MGDLEGESDRGLLRLCFDRCQPALNTPSSGQIEDGELTGYAGPSRRNGRPRPTRHPPARCAVREDALWITGMPLSLDRTERT